MNQDAEISSEAARTSDAWQALERLRTDLRRDGDGVCPVRPRLLRQIIKADRDLIGLAYEVPHEDCYVMPLAELKKLVSQEGYLLDTGGLKDPVVLVAEPTPDDIEQLPLETLHRRLLTLEYHARVHARLDALCADGRLDEALAKRIEQRAGRDEVAEGLIALDAERRILPPRERIGMVCELIATFLEVRTFHPRLVPVWFPSLDPGRMEEAIGLLGVPFDLRSILGRAHAEKVERYLPAHADEARPDPRCDGEDGGLPEPDEPPPEAGPAVDPRKPARLLARAASAHRKGNLARAMVLRWHAARLLPDPAARRALTLEGDADLKALAARLTAALQGRGPSEARWVRVLRPLALNPGRGLWPRPAKLLYDLQKVCLDAERPAVVLDLFGWARSAGVARIQRTLDDQVPVRIHRHVRTALARALTLEPKEVREPLVRALREAEHLANDSIRTLFGPQLRGALDKVGLGPKNLPEEVAAAKVTAGLLDRICRSDYINIGDLRDELSQNDLKMQDMASFRSLVLGDALLQADQLLARELEGVYRKSPFYMRTLQRWSSLAFGNGVGRALTRYVALPLLGAFVVLEALQHIVHPIASALGLHAPHLGSLPAVLGLGVVLLAHLESATLRTATWRWLKAFGRALRLVVLRAPLGLLKLPIVRHLVDSYGFALIRRFVLRPLIPAAVVLTLMPLLGIDRRAGLIVGGGLFLALSIFLNTYWGKVLEARIGDAGGLLWARVRHRLLPNLFRFVMEIFRRLLSAFERLRYSVDEGLRFRQGDRRLAFFLKLVFGSAWSAVMYLIQLCMNLLVEPQINPIKHFPVVTVSHKVMLSQAPTLAGIMGGTLAGITVSVVPGFFGFLVWELSANWKLYEASRPGRLGPVMVGSHGETVSALLRPGFHAGTVPKIFTRIRRRALRAIRRGGQPSPERDREVLHHVEEAVARFVDRELLAVCRAAPGFEDRLVLGPVRLGLSRILIEAGPAEKEPLRLTFTERHGTLVATLTPGFAALLPARPRAVLSDALVGLLLRAEVDAIERESGPESEPALQDLSKLAVSWAQWVERWEADRRGEAPEPLGGEKVAPLPVKQV